MTNVRVLRRSLGLRCPPGMLHGIKKGAASLIVLAIILTLPYVKPVGKGTLYVTAKAEVPVWSQASSGSAQIRLLPLNAYVSIVSTVTNAAGNPWGKTVNGTWIYMGNLKATTKALPSTGLYITIADSVPLRYEPAASATTVKSLGRDKCLAITDTYYTDTGNPWATTSDGYVVYMGNIEKHSHTATACGPPRTSYATVTGAYHQKTVYNGDLLCRCGHIVGQGTTTITDETHGFLNNTCIHCGFIREILPSAGSYETARENVPLRNSPSADAPVHHYIEKTGTPVFITSTYYNSLNNPWGTTSDGYAVYMGNLRKPSTVAVTGLSIDPAVLTLTVGGTQRLTGTVLPTNATSRSVNWISSNPAVASVDTAGIVTARAVGSAIITCRSTSQSNISDTCSIKVLAAHAHQYVGGLCSCGHEYPLTLIPMASVVRYTNKSNVPVWNRPYSRNSDQVRTIMTSGTALTMTAHTTNQEGNLWYRLSDGNWVYGGNTTANPPFVAVTGLSLSQSTLKLTAGSASRLTCAISPANATDRTVGWTSSNPTVARVDPEGNVTAQAPGTATITCRSAIQPNIAATCMVTVTDHPVHSYIGGLCACGLEAPLTLVSMPDTRLYTIKSDIPIWNRPYSQNSSRVRIVPVAGTALTVTARATNQEGNLWYRLSDGNWVFSGNTATTPPAVAVSGISLNAVTLTLMAGTTGQLVATVQPANAGNRTILWSSTNPSVASVDADGKVTAKAPGTTEITCRSAANRKIQAIIAVTVVLVHNHAYLNGVCACGDRMPSTTDPNGTPGLISVIPAGIAGREAMVLKWESVPDAIEYCIERKAPGQQEFELTDRVPAGLISWHDSTILPGASYSYRVRSVRRTFLWLRTTSAPSNEVSARWIQADSLAIAESRTHILLHEVLTLRAIVEPQDVADRTVVWSTSDPDIAVVTQDGTVQPRQSGRVLVLAATTDGRLQATRELTILQFTLPIRDTDPIITSNFGWRYHPKTKVKKFHHGVDLVSSIGKNRSLYPIGSGTVIATGFHSSAGKYIVIRHENGMYSCYFHCETIYVHIGQVLDKDSRIGIYGTTGESTGNHLHLELRGHWNRALFSSNYRDLVLNPSLIMPDLKQLAEYMEPILERNQLTRSPY